MEFKALKFEVGVVNEVTLSFDEPRITPSTKFPGKNMIWYGIKEMITGENGFNSSESLNTMIQLEGAKTGDTIEIKKLQGDTYAYFTVNGKTMDDFRGQVTAEVNEGVAQEKEILSPTPQQAVEQVVQSFAPPSEKVDYIQKPNEKTTAEKVDILWARFIKDNPDEELPF